jgi:acetolactate synthase-1/2/3 large subunit
MTTHFWRVPPVGVRAIQIDIDGEGLGRNYPLDAAIVSDAKVALERLLAQCDTRTASRRQAWLERVSAVRAGWYEKYQSQLTSGAAPIRPERICGELSEHVPADAVVVVDTGHAGMWMGGMYDLSDSAQSYIRSAGHLGWAFPAGLGAKCAVPDRPVITFTGDAGIWYHIAELETAVRWRINAITIVNNNSSGNQSRPGFDRVYGNEQSQKGRELWTFTDVSFAAIAESVGALGIRVDEPQQFAPALSRALEANRPVLIDVVTDIDALAPNAVV